MLFQVGEFCERVETDLSGLADELQELTGRFGDQERRTWMTSLPKLSIVLAKPDLSSFHLSLGNSGHVAFEYRLPASSSWCDAVLLGQCQNLPAAVILELKEWDLTGDAPGPRESLIYHHGNLLLHPADQVRGYVQYCRRFHSAVADYKALVDGCVFFTSKVNPNAYKMPPHDLLTQSFPVFSFTDDNINDLFVPFLRQRLAVPAPDFADAFDRGVYRQDRNFVTQVAVTISDEAKSPFVLLDEQRRGYERVLDEIDKRMAVHAKEKMVIVVEGPPGSGKSVLAAHLWASLAQSGRVDGNIVFVTTSGCQRKNWESLFERMSGEKAGRGIVMPANRFNPGLSPIWVKEQREQGHAMLVHEWTTNYELFKQIKKPKIKDGAFSVAIVDEAHALIDPTAPGAEGVPPSGWAMHAGPQAYHVMRCSDVSIFLMDSEQSYRDNETTTPSSIRKLAEDMGIDHVVTISLAGSQFRCGGSAAYLDWVEHVLSPDSKTAPPATWNRVSNKQGTFELTIVDDPLALDEHLGRHLADGRTSRLAATYARPWKTKGVAKPHELPQDKKDFSIAVTRNGQERMWAKIWNYVPGEDYSLFIQGTEGSAIADDPLCEVGCPYVIRGFDFDYLGVLWLSDLVWRNDRWVAQVDHVHDSALPRTKKAAKGEGKNRKGADPTELIKRLQRGYRILLSRAIHGIYLWVEDEETRLHLQRLMVQ